MPANEPGRSSISARIRLTQPSAERTATGIYGVIVSAAVLAAAHAPTTLATALAVLVTLIAYWAAERYSRLVAERIHEGHRPSWQHVRQQLTSGWEMVTASALPLATMIVLRLLGLTQFASVLGALVCSTLLLGLAGWEVGRHGQLNPLERLISAAVAGAFGAVMIVLKTMLH
jgi:hypothetical protein